MHSKNHTSSPHDRYRPAADHREMSISDTTDRHSQLAVLGGKVRSHPSSLPAEHAVFGISATLFTLNRKTGSSEDREQCSAETGAV